MGPFDPLEGTTLYQAGFEGAATSIGRLPLDAPHRLFGLHAVGVVPVDHHGRLPGLDGGGGRVDGQEVAGLLELAEELNPRRDVVGRAALRQRGHHHAGERRTGLRGITV